jgi:hypothetical protein
VQYQNETQPEVPIFPERSTTYPVPPLDSLAPDRTPPTMVPIPAPLPPAPTHPLVTQPAPAPKRKMPLWVKVAIGAFVGCFAFCGFVGLLVGVGANGGTSTTATATVQRTQVPTAKPSVKAPVIPESPKSWVVVAAFTGNGNQHTGSFRVSAQDWRLLWVGNPATFFGSSYNIMASVLTLDGSYADFGAINAICSPSNRTGSTEEHNLPGTFYLDISSEAAWTFKIEVYK